MRRIKTALSISAALFGLAFIATVPAAADQVILDDLIVDGSACVGFDCVNGESFGFDTLRLKENNLRIKAQDTSTSASFPTNDWQITFNETTNGGRNKFSIDDIDGGRTPFTIEAGAPSHSLYVEDGGRIGLGTSTPVVEVHIVDGDTPTLRLEQDGSSGFTPQTWDLAGNETNLFIRDVTNGSKLPFRIRPNAPTSSIDVEGTTGDVGFGTTSPAQPIHVRRTNSTARILVEEASGSVAGRTMMELKNNGPVTFRLTNDSTSDNWFARLLSNDRLAFSDESTGTDLQIDNTGNVFIEGELTTTGASCSVTPCDAVFLPEAELPSIDEHAAYMWQNQHLEAVGPTSPEEPFNMTAKTTGMLNELEKAHIYIEQLHKRLTALEEQLAADETGQ